MVGSGTCTSLRRFLTAVLTFTLTVSSPLPAFAQDSTGADTSGASIYDRYLQAQDFRVNRQYDRSAEVLLGIIDEYRGSDVRLAYDLLVYNTSEAEGHDTAREVAREALEVYPDLANDRKWVPDRIGQIYEDLRAEMFGAVEIRAADPDLKESPVFINGELKGEIPLVINYLRTGEYELKVARSGYEDQVLNIDISPSSHQVFNITLNRKGRSKWWLGAGVVAAAVVGVLVGGGDSGTSDTLEPLPGPPDPPGK